MAYTIAWQGRGLFCTLCLGLALAQPAAWGQTDEGAGSRWQRLKQVLQTQRENKQARVSEESLGAKTGNTRTIAYGGREILLYVPSNLPPQGQRALLVALHGGGGNAEFMRDHLKMDGVAERHGFLVAYLNGTAAAAIGGERLKAWNAGSGCCGKPYTDKVDDLGYVAGAVQYLQRVYGVPVQRSFGVGHSNGAMMVQTLACRSGVFTTVASLAGTLMSDDTACPTARGHTIYNYHGADDQNVPLAGGFGSKGVTTIDFTPQAKAQTLFEKAGGHYQLQVFEGADHSIEHISESSQKLDGRTIAERIAQDLGLVVPGR